MIVDMVPIMTTKGKGSRFDFYKKVSNKKYDKL